MKWIGKKTSDMVKKHVSFEYTVSISILKEVQRSDMGRRSGLELLILTKRV